MAKFIQYIWKVWLTLNLLTKDKDNDYRAEVSTVGNTARNEDVVQIIIKDGSEIKYETLLSILNRGDEIKRTFILEGRSVQDGVCHIKPGVYGPWDGPNAKFDEKVNSIGLEITASPEMREALKSVQVESLGEKNSGAYIGKVTDSVDGESSEVITSNGIIVIEGDKIKVYPENEEGTGIFFENIDSGEKYQVSKKLIQNDPKKIIAQIPALPVGKYSLSIVTRFSQGQRLLQAQRTIVYDRILEIHE